MTYAYDPMTVNAKIGEKIVHRRQELNMSATELARKANLTQPQLSLYESGQRNMGVDKLVAIAAALMVPLSYLQPMELDRFIEPKNDYENVIALLRQLPPDQRRIMIKMFEAQLKSLKE